MPRGWLCGVVLLVGSTVVSAQAPLFTSGIDLVHVGVSVTDDDGEPIVDLSPEDVEVFEDGVRQELRYFSRGVQSDTDEIPVHLGVLFDASGSMGEEGRFAKTAAIRFLNAMTYAQDMTLVDFDNEVRVGRYGQADFARLVERIRNRQPGGMTAFYDALGVYLDGAFSQEGRKVLVMYSDGEDTRSRTTFSDIVELLRASDVTAYAIGFHKHLRSTNRMVQRQRLGELAGITGGRTFFPSDVDEIEGVYEQIAEDLDNRYSIGYVSTNQRADGTWRRLEIKIRETRPDWSDVKVRTREGYYAPFLEAKATER